MFKYCSASEPVSLSAKCTDIDLAPSLSLSESLETKFTHSFAKWSYSLHLKHLTLSLLFRLVLNPNLELDGDLTLLSLSLDLDCLHVFFLPNSTSVIIKSTSKVTSPKLPLPLPYPLLILLQSLLNDLFPLQLLLCLKFHLFCPLPLLW